MVQNNYWIHLYKNAKFSANTEIEDFLQLLPPCRECGLVKFKEKSVGQVSPAADDSKVKVK